MIHGFAPPSTLVHGYIKMIKLTIKLKRTEKNKVNKIAVDSSLVITNKPDHKEAIELLKQRIKKIQQENSRLREHIRSDLW